MIRPWIPFSESQSESQISKLKIDLWEGANSMSLKTAYGLFSLLFWNETGRAAGRWQERVHARKGKVASLAFEKVDIYLRKIGFVDCTWSNFNVPGTYAPWSHSLLRSTVGCPFPSMQEKGSAASGFWKSEQSVQCTSLWNFRSVPYIQFDL